MLKLFTTKTGVRKLTFGSKFILWSNLAAMDLRSEKIKLLNQNILQNWASGYTPFMLPPFLQQSYCLWCYVQYNYVVGSKFHEVGSCLNNKPSCDITTARMPDGLKNVRLAVLRSRWWSARKYDTSVMKSELILHLTLHQDLNCPLKTKAVQAPSICNSNSIYFLQ